MQYLTSENIYWRLFYLLPFPLVVGVAAAELIQRSPTTVRTYVFTATALIIALCAVWASPTSVVRKDNAWIGWPGYKLYPEHLEITRSIMSKIPPGNMLAPPDLANTIVTVTSLYPQVAVRADMLILRFSAVGEMGEVQRRIAAASYLMGDGDDGRAFEEVLLAKNRPRSVVLPPRAAAHPQRRDALTRNGYTQVAELPGGWIGVFTPGS